MVALVARLAVAATALSTLTVASFATAASAASPTPTVYAATLLTSASATLNASVNPGGTSTTLTFCYSTSTITISGGACSVTSGTVSSAAASQSPSTAATSTIVSAVVSGLSAGTTYYYAIGATQSGSATAFSAVASFTTMTGGPFACIPQLYQENSNFLWRFDGASSSFVKVNTTSQPTSLNPIAYDTLNNYLYGMGGSTLFEVGADGNERSLGKPAFAGTIGGDLLPGTHLLVTENAAGSWYMEDVASASPATSVVPRSVKLGVTSGSASYTAYDVAFQLVGTNYVGWGLSMSGTGTATLFKAVIPQGVIAANADSSKWSSLSKTTIANAITVTSVTGMTFSGGTTPASSDGVGADYQDNAGNALFYFNNAKEIYTATAAKLATGAKFALTFSTNASILAAGANDGASCPSTSSAFSAPVPVSDAYLAPAGSTLSVSSSSGTPLLANDQILPGATVSMGTVTLEPGPGQVSTAYSTGHTSGSLVGANGTLNVTDSTKGYFTFTPKAGFNGTETYTYNLVETAPFSLTSASSATVTINFGKAAQSITFTSTAPSNPSVGATYTPSATGGASGNPVTFSIDASSTSGCAYAAGTGKVTFASPAGTCVIDANQAGNAGYFAAAQSQQPVTVVKATQAITFTSSPPASPTVGTSYLVHATGGASGNPVTLSIDATSTSGCAIDAAGTVSLNAPSGTCVIDANQAGSAGYLSAAQSQQSLAVAKGSQGVAFTSSAPSPAKVGTSYVATATGGASGNPIVFSIDASSSAGCAVEAATGKVTFQGPVGNCVLDANQAGNVGWNPAPQAQQIIVLAKGDQTIAVTTTAPSAATVGGATYTPAATGGGSGNPVVLSIDATSTSGCTYSPGTGKVTFASPAGTCVIDANQAGSASWNAAAQAQQTFGVAKGAQAVAFTSSAPSNPGVGVTYTPTATGGASGNPVTFTIDASSTSGCAFNPGTGAVSFAAPIGTCVIDANQAGTAGWNAAAQAQQTATVTKGTQTITFTSVAPSSPPVNSTYQVTATGGASGNPITLSIDATSTSGCNVDGAGKITFAGPAGTCVIDANQAGNAAWNPAAQAQQSLGVVKATQTISFTSSAPGAPPVGSSYLAAATGGGSGKPVTLTVDATSTSGCTIDAAAKVTFTAPIGTCVIDANQAGDASYLAAPQATQSTTVVKAPQQISFTSSPPASPVVGGTYDASATGGGSGNPVTFSIDATSTSGCTVGPLSGHVSLNGPAGTCVIDANQAGSDAFAAAAQAQQVLAVAKAAQQVTFTSSVPSPARVGGTYSAAATGGGSGGPITFSIDASSSAGCTIDAVSGVVTLASPAGTCVIDADQAGDVSYLPATEAQQVLNVQRAFQSVSFTSVAPAGASVGASYVATATGGASGNPVTLTVDPASSAGCTIDAANRVSFGSPAGTCVVDANQAGNAGYFAAAQAQQVLSIAKAPQAVAFSSTAPIGAVVGASYLATTTSGASGNPVLLTIDASSTSGCAVNTVTGKVSFGSPAGTCVVDADQAGSAGYLAAAQAQQSFAVAKAPQVVAFTSAAPSAAGVGSGYTATASAGASGNPVIFTIDPASTSGCTVGALSGQVSFGTPAGTCVIDADQAGNTGYLAAPRATQPITVHKAAQAIEFSTPVPLSPSVGASYAPGATGGASGNPVTFAIDASSTSGCTVDGAGTVNFDAPAGTCVIDADQAGDAGYLPAPRALQSVLVGKTAQSISFTTAAPVGPAVGATYTPAATGGASGNPVTLSIDASSTSGCTIDGAGTVTFDAPAGTCVIDADQAGSAAYGAAPRVTQLVHVGQAAQAITFVTAAPGGAVVGAHYDVTATGGASGNPVVLTVDAGSTSGCTLSAGRVQFAAPAGTCVIDANQAGDQSYLAAPQATQPVSVAKAAQGVVFSTTAPASAAVGATYSASASGGASGNPVVLSIDPSSTSGCVVDPASGLVSFAGPAGTCVLDADQAGDAGYLAAARAQQSVAVGKSAQLVAFVSTPPSPATVGSTYTAAATGGASGSPVTFSIDATSTSGCTVDASSGLVSLHAPAGSCVIDADQAGDGSFADAPRAAQGFTVQKAPQTIVFTSLAPAGSVGATYQVAATGGASGTAVTLSIDAASSSGCTMGAGGLVSFHAPIGTCVIDANQAGDAGYLPAPLAQQSVGVGLAPQAITFDTTPSAPTVFGTYAAAASGGGSGNPVTLSVDLSSTSGCTIDAAGLVTFHTPAGTCVLDADQAGSAAYFAAPEVTQVIVVAGAPQVITFTSVPPADPQMGSSYPVTATGGASGNPVVLSIDPSSTSGCTLLATYSIVSFQAPGGTCVIVANQAGDATYAAAAQVQQLLALAKNAQAITFSSARPVGVRTGSTYLAAAQASSGLPIALRVDDASSGICAMSGARVTMNRPGTCVIDADQAGNAFYAPASRTQLRLRVVAPSRASLTLVFAGRSSTLTAASKARLAALARSIQSHVLSRVLVTGYAGDARGARANKALGLRRAQVAAAYLRAQLRQRHVTGVHVVLRTRASASNRPSGSPALRRCVISAS